MRRRRSHWTPARLIGAVAVITYLNALGGGFVSDAGPIIANNRVLQYSREWLPWFTRDFYWGSTLQDVTLFRPLTILSFLFHIRTTGLAPFPFLLGNVLLHAGISALVFWLGSRLVGRLGAFVGALIFAVHPLHTEAVAWIMGRSELLAAIFALTACLSSLRAIDPDEPRPGRFAAGAVAAYLAALFSKEHVALLPLWFALAWLLVRPNRLGRHAAYVGLGSAAVFVVFLILRTNALTREAPASVTGLYNPAAVVPAPFRWLTAAAVVWRYTLLFVWPAQLSNDYSYAQTEASTGLGGAEAAGILVILAILGGIVVAWRRAPGVALSLALVPLTFFLVSNFPFPLVTVMAERLTYLPSLGGCLVAGWLLTRLPLPAVLRRWTRLTGSGISPAEAGEWHGRESSARSDRRGAVMTWVIVGLIFVLGVRTVVRNPDWRDSYTLYTSALRAGPKNAHVLTVLSGLERGRGNDERAMELAQQALQIYPDNFYARIAAAEIHLKLRQFDQALEYYQKAIALAPQDAAVYNNFGVVFRRFGLLREAEQAFAEALRLAPNLAPAHVGLAGILLETGRPREALDQFREAARLSPGDPLPLYSVASAALAARERQTAQTYALRATAMGFRVPDEFWRALTSSP